MTKSFVSIIYHRTTKLVPFFYRSYVDVGITRCWENNKSDQNMFHPVSSHANSECLPCGSACLSLRRSLPSANRWRDYQGESTSSGSLRELSL